MSEKKSINEELDVWYGMLTAVGFGVVQDSIHSTQT